MRHRDDDPGEACPTEEFFAGLPDTVATDLFSIVEDVAKAPPPRFSGGGFWEAMHGEMSGYYEARTVGPGRRHYRLFCILERAAQGLAGPTIVCITGLSKKHGQTFTSADYGRVRALGDEYRRRLPRAVE